MKLLLQPLCVLLLVASIARAEDGRAFDSVTGRDTRNYPPDAQVDYQHIALDLDMRDPMSRSFKCVETITFKTLGRPVDHVDLNAVNFKIDSVTTLDGKPLGYRYDDKVLTLAFGSALPANTDSGAKISYSVAKPQAGMIFALPEEGYKDRPLSIHTQGEAETNRYWFACHDYPNEKQTTEITVAIPSNLVALSNGALVSKEDAGNNLTRWHYKLSKPHVSYLVSLVIGDLAIVRDEWRGKPVEYWVPKWQEANAKRTFGKTPEMMELFSKLTGFDYPWEKYAQAVVYNFEAGGMENTSATTLVETTTIDDRAALDSDVEGLVSHELAHQWFGDTLTCRSWQHIWLNEGFATFMNHVWTEHAQGKDAYAHDIWRGMNQVAASDDVTLRGGVVWPFYEGAEQTFGRGASNPYGKGSVVLHMLRQSLGDELFWNVIGTFVKRHAFQNVETDDLRKICDELSGRSYEQFFQQWIYRAGTPSIKVHYDWDESEHEARITLEQTQPITIDAPAFAVDVDVRLSPRGKPIGEHRTIAMNGRSASITVQMDSEPAQVVFDLYGAVLAKWDLSELPTRMLIEQAHRRMTPFARLNAVAALAGRDRDDVRDTLKSILLDDRQHESYRSEAAAALGKMHQSAARDILLDALREDAAIKDHRVRRAAVAALGEYGHDPKARETFLRFAKHDETYSVEAAATTALGSQNLNDDVMNVLVANANKDSYRDQIRSAALASLGALGDPRGLEVATKLAAYGQPFRARSSAIETIGAISRAMRDAGGEGSGTRVNAQRDLLVKLLDDPQARNAGAAARALGVIGDERALPDLKRFANGAALERVRDAAKSAIEKIENKSHGDGAVKVLRDRIDALENAAREHAGRREMKEQLSPTTAPTTQP